MITLLWGHLNVADIRFGSKADVYFTPKSGHRNSLAECPLWVKSRHSPAFSQLSALPPKADIHCASRNVRVGPNSAKRSEASTLSLLKYNYRLVVTNNPREASARVNCWITLSVIVKFLAFCMSRRSAFNAGSLSLITHRHTNTLAS